jgi:hypothetical protein
MTDSRDIAVLRELATRYADICAKPIQDERRDLWRRHNSLEPTRPLVYVRWFACANELIDPQLVCEDPFYRGHERVLRRHLFQDELGDDFILEPWIAVGAKHVLPPEGHWGVPIRHSEKTDPNGSWMFVPPLRERDDLAKMVVPRHEIDEAATARAASRLHDAIGDRIPVVVDRSPVWSGWRGDISTDLARLRGLEQMMLDMAMNPDWLHRLVGFMRDGILKSHEEAERAGDWRLLNHQNQAMPYATELPDPATDEAAVTRDQLWIFVASQETTEVSPAMFDEFIVQYQLPIAAKFGLCAYGCCEDLTRKIDVLRQIPNLRRIAVAPRANLATCVEQIGTEYVVSWRPNPATHACCDFDADFVRSDIRQAFETARGTHVDVTLKDVETVGGDPNRLVEWARIAMEEAERAAG